MTTPNPTPPQITPARKQDQLLSRAYLNEEQHEADQFLDTLIDNCKNGQVIHVEF